MKPKEAKMPERKEYSWKDDPRGMYPSEQYWTEMCRVDSWNACYDVWQEYHTAMVKSLLDIIYARTETKP